MLGGWKRAVGTQKIRFNTFKDGWFSAAMNSKFGAGLPLAIGIQTWGKNTKKLAEFYGVPTSAQFMTEIKHLEGEIDMLLRWEERYWKQRARADWIKEGDRNTKYFLAKASK
ncbi:Uncharacterized protein Adt_44738 [Abeliophyllum distichum]|uniref:Uncharacterized protein n=1 Tax=Abeliophyllum distichum TaxID=126358 RepID=A0ABD1PD30_9LAMI